MTPSADLILHHGNVLTMDPRRLRREMVAIRGDRILAVGGNHQVADLQGPGTRLIHCRGKTVLPGFVDAHTHLLAQAAFLLSVDCRQAPSLSHLQALIRQKAAQLPPGRWVRAVGYNEFYLSEKRHPTRGDLDAAAPHHPVRLNHSTGHAAVLNSLALSLVGITAHTPDPPGGWIERDEAGQPTGLLLDMEGYLRERTPLLNEEEVREGLRQVGRSYLSLGVTSLEDATVHNSLKEWRAFARWHEEGGLPQRLRIMVGFPALDEVIAQGMASDHALPGRGGAVKIVLEETGGRLHPPDLAQQVLRAHSLGFQVALHAVDTVAAAVAALEYAVGQLPRPNHRHRIEHASLCPPPLQRRLKRLGAIVVTQPAFLYYSGPRYLEMVSPRDIPWLYPIASFVRSGLKPAASSDAPVAPPNPLVGIYAAVTRRAETGQYLSPHQGIPPLQALRMYTAAAAYATFAEKEIGSITPGKRADLILLDADPTQVPVAQIKEIQVVTTILGGRLAWQGADL